MEIERKFLVSELPEDIEQYPCRVIEQGYLCTEPVVRMRRDNDKYELTYKSKGLMIREEHNLPLTKEAYEHLIMKADGCVIRKKRYMIPLIENLSEAAGQQGRELMIELDIFEGDLEPLILAEVEFPDEESADHFTPPTWFGEDVTFSVEYQNSTLSRK